MNNMCRALKKIYTIYLPLSFSIYSALGNNLS